MFVVLSEDLEQQVVKAAKGRRASARKPLMELSARLDAEEELVSVGRVGERHPRGRPEGDEVRCLVVKLPEDGRPSYPPAAGTPDDSPVVVLAAPRDGKHALKAFLFASESSAPEECEIEVIRLETDLFSRLKGIFDTSVLAPKTVAVLGLGSGGGVGAVELAKAGVGNFILVDFDRLKAHNIARHVCGLSDVGRYKTRAVRDAIAQRNPLASVLVHEVDITQEPELLYEIVEEANLVFVATDTELSRYMVNEACLHSDTPAVYGGVYERAFAGEVLRVIPGRAACYACVRQGMADTMRSISTQQTFDYTDDSDFQAEPGLGLDVAFISMLQTKVALLTLLRDSDSSLGDIESEMIIWSNQAKPEDGALFEWPMSRYFVKVPRSETCAVCGIESDFWKEDVDR